MIDQLESADESSNEEDDIFESPDDDTPFCEVDLSGDALRVRTALTAIGAMPGATLESAVGLIRLILGEHGEPGGAPRHDNDVCPACHYGHSG